MERSIKVSLNTVFYSAGAVSKSVGDFGDVADFKIRKRRGYIDVFISKFSDGVAADLGGEFANYVLFVEGTQRSAHADKDR